MFFYRSQYTEVALQPFCIVVIYVVFNHLYKSISVCKSLPVVAFPFQNAPEALHWAIINTFGYAGHALLHSGVFKHGMECSVRILESTVRMEQRMYIRIGLNCCPEGVEDQGIVIVIANHKGNNATVKQVKDGTEINLMYDRSLIPLKLRNISQPLFIWLVCLKFSIQLVLGNILRVRSMPRAAIVGVFDGRLDPFSPADPQHPLVADLYLVVFFQIVSDPPVAFIRILSMNFLGKCRNTLILLLTMALFPACPFVIC